MIKGWNVLQKFPEVISADEVFWVRFLFRNLNKITKILTIIPKETKCIVCENLSLNFTSRSSLANHIKNHGRETVYFWLNNFVSKSPDELESMLYESGFRGVADY